MIFSQAGIYGVVLCGIRNLRVWFGPLPSWICYLHVQFTQILIFEFVLFMVFYITLTRFLFICIWRRMREMNDDLIVAILVNCSMFLSMWATFTDLTREEIRTEKLCLGDFFTSDGEMDWQEITKPKRTELPK